MKNKIEDLRNHLFAQLERLQDDDLDLDKEMKRAQSMVSVSSSIIESAKVENEFLRITQGDSSQFIDTSVKGHRQLNGSGGGEKKS